VLGGAQSVGPTLSQIKVLGGQNDTPDGVVTEKNFFKKVLTFCVNGVIMITEIKKRGKQNEVQSN
jgi:hypothetical protein